MNEVKPNYPRRFFSNTSVYKEWYLVSKGPSYLHNENGPAREYTNGAKEWWLNNKLIKEGGCPSNWDDLVLLAQIERFLDE